MGPWTPPSHIPHLSPLPPCYHHPSYTSRSYTSYCSRSFLPATRPGGPRCALIALLGHVGGNDLPRQGQRPLSHHLRQWNYGSVTSTARGEISFGVLLGFFWFPFPSNLLIYNVLTRLCGIGPIISTSIMEGDSVENTL